MTYKIIILGPQKANSELIFYSLIFREFDSVEASTTGGGVAGALKNRNTFHICHSAPVELQRSHSRRRVPTTGSWTDVIVQRIRPLCNWSTTREKYSTARNILSTLGSWWTFSEQRMFSSFIDQTSCFDCFCDDCFP